MPRVLIPFSDLASGERALRRLLARPRDPRLAVDLLAVVEPLTPGKVAVFVSPALAKAQAQAAGDRWLAQLASMLDAAGIPHRSQVANGRLPQVLRREGARADIDEVLLGTREHDPLRRWRRRSIAYAMNRPLATVS